MPWALLQEVNKEFGAPFCHTVIIVIYVPRAPFIALSPLVRCFPVTNDRRARHQRGIEFVIGTVFEEGNLAGRILFCAEEAVLVSAMFSTVAQAAEASSLPQSSVASRSVDGNNIRRNYELYLGPTVKFVLYCGRCFL